MRGFFLAFLFVVWGGAALYAQAEFFQGTNLGSSARMIRMANVEGFSQLSSTIFDNPAGMMTIPSERHVNFFYSQLLQEVDYKNIAGTIKTPYGVFGAGIMLTEVSAIPVTTQDISSDPDNPIFLETGEYFDYLNGVMKLSYGFSQSNHLHFGLSASYYFTKIHTYTGDGMNLDAGMLYDTPIFGTSIVLRNVASGLKVKYSNGGSETLSLQTIYGVRYRFMPDVQLYGQVKIVGGSKKMANSAAVVYTPAFLPYITVSGGYKEFLVLKEVKGGMSLGLGLTLGSISADYAFEQSEHPEFNGKHYLSMGFAF
jgi:hypothetical protein